MTKKKTVIKTKKKNKNMDIKSQVGFSLIELLVVVAILGIVSAVAVPQYHIYTHNAHTAKALQAATFLKKKVSQCHLTAGNNFETLCISKADEAFSGIPSEADGLPGISAFSVKEGVVTVYSEGRSKHSGEFMYITATPSINDHRLSWKWVTSTESTDDNLCASSEATRSKRKVICHN